MSRMLRFSLLSLLSLILLSACTPRTAIQDNVVPVLYLITPAENVGDLVTLQGRYFGDGQGGVAEDTYVILGSDINSNGGVRISPSSWTPSKITFTMPEGVGYGYVFVVVDGHRSNGLPANLP